MRLIKFLNLKVASATFVHGTTEETGTEQLWLVEDFCNSHACLHGSGSQKDKTLKCYFSLHSFPLFYYPDSILSHHLMKRKKKLTLPVQRVVLLSLNISLNATQTLRPPKQKRTNVPQTAACLCVEWLEKKTEGNDCEEERPVSQLKVEWRKSFTRTCFQSL